MFNITDVVFKYVSAALLIVCLGMGVTIFSQNQTIKSKDDKITSLAADNATLTVNLNTAVSINKDLNKTIEVQNTAIKKLEAEKKALDGRLIKADENAKKVKAAFQKRIDDLLREPVSNDCDSALNWLRIKAPDLSVMPVIEQGEVKFNGQPPQINPPNHATTAVPMNAEIIPIPTETDQQTPANTN